MDLKANPCPACQNQDALLVIDGGGEERLIRCQVCRLTYVDPPISQAALAPIYSGRKPLAEGDRYPFNKAAHRHRRARVRAWRLRRYLQNADALDIGCGGGFMVEAMHRRGARASGVDLDPGAIAYARNNHSAENQFHCGAPTDLLARGLSFDFIHCAQVIEHVGEINDFIAAMVRLLRLGGRVYLKTPDRDHWLVRHEPKTWPKPPQYVHYFTRPALRHLLSRHGFVVERMFVDLKPSIQVVARRRP